MNIKRLGIYLGLSLAIGAGAGAGELALAGGASATPSAPVVAVASQVSALTTLPGVAHSDLPSQASGGVVRLGQLGPASALGSGAAIVQLRSGLGARGTGRIYAYPTTSGDVCVVETDTRGTGLGCVGGFTDEWPISPNILKVKDTTTSAYTESVWGVVPDGVTGVGILTATGGTIATVVSNNSFYADVPSSAGTVTGFDITKANGQELRVPWPSQG